MKEQLTNMNGAVVTERGQSAGGNEMYFFHINKKDHSANVEVEAVEEPVVEVYEEVVREQEEQYGEYKSVEIPDFGTSSQYEYTYEEEAYEDYTEYSYDYSYTQQDADFRTSDSGYSTYDHREHERASRAAYNKRCRKPKNDLEKFAKYRLGVNLDSVDRIKEGVSNLFN